MKNKFLLLSTIVFVLAIITSCQKTELTGTTTYQNISATIRAGEIYSVNLGSIKENSVVTISKQAKHFLKSETSKTFSASTLPNVTPVSLSYSYTSAAGFAGLESIQITVTDEDNDSDSTHACNHNGNNNSNDNDHHSHHEHGEHHGDNDNEGDRSVLNKTIYNIQLTVLPLENSSR